MLKITLLIAALFSAMSPFAACAKTTPETAYATFRADREPGYLPVKTALQALARDGAARGAQHFCVIGYVGTAASPAKFAWVHWREKKRLIYWLPAADGFAPKDTLLRSTRSLDLAQDVVATDAEVGSSSFLVSRPWVDGVIKDCKARGVNYVVTAK
jgi:hypothetical protein